MAMPGKTPRCSRADADHSALGYEGYIQPFRTAIYRHDFEPSKSIHSRLFIFSSVLGDRLSAGEGIESTEVGTPLQWRHAQCRGVELSTAEHAGKGHRRLIRWLVLQSVICGLRSTPGPYRLRP